MPNIAVSKSWLLKALAWAIGGAVAAMLSGGALVAIALAFAYPNLPPIDSLTDYRPKLPLRVFSSDGMLLAEFGEERRTFTPIAQIPLVMRHAVLAVEDARFYEHEGVDILGIVRAGLANVGEAKSQGGSTITMQVARNFYLSSEKTFTRKIYEILLALKIETQLSKDQILEVYMNQIFLGQRAYGFAAAAQTYFGKPLAELTTAEAALLAGLPKAPSAYNPFVNPQRALQRQRYILDRMLEVGFIDEAEHARARAQELRYRRPSEVRVHAEHAAETARQLVFAQYGEEAYTRGLNVTLTIDTGDQNAAFRALRDGLMAFERRQHFRGPEAYVDLPTDPAALDLRIAEALADHPDNDELRAVVVLEASPQRVVAALQSGETITVTGAGLKPVESGLSAKAPPNRQIRRGAVVRAVRLANGSWTLTQMPEVEAAFVALEPKTGHVRAMVGGFDFRKSAFNRVTQGWRQPGSSFKPFIYSAALEYGVTPTTVVNDAPLFFDATATGSQPWEPKNYDGKYEGPMTMRRGLTKSKNMISIRILNKIGAKYGQEYATRFGFDAEKNPPYLTLALGAGAVTPLQMAGAYAVFANGGYKINPYLITKVTDGSGKILSQTVPEKAGNEANRVIDERNAYLMDSMLKDVVKHGTATRALVLKRSDIAGKTGTTNDSFDAWFAGYQPKLVGIAWIGFDQPKNLGNRETGGGLALPIWIGYMQKALKDVPNAERPVPDGLIQAGSEYYYAENPPGSGVRNLDTGSGGGEKSTGTAPAEEAKTQDEVKNQLF